MELDRIIEFFLLISILKRLGSGSGGGTAECVCEYRRVFYPVCGDDKNAELHIDVLNRESALGISINNITTVKEVSLEWVLL